MTTTLTKGLKGGLLATTTALALLFGTGSAHADGASYVIPNQRASLPHEPRTNRRRTRNADGTFDLSRRRVRHGQVAA